LSRLCPELGHTNDVIKNLFLIYGEAMSNDFMPTNGGPTVELVSYGCDDWSVGL